MAKRRRLPTRTFASMLMERNLFLMSVRSCLRTSLVKRPIKLPWFPTSAFHSSTQQSSPAPADVPLLPFCFSLSPVLHAIRMPNRHDEWQTAGLYLLLPRAGAGGRGRGPLFRGVAPRPATVCPPAL